MQNAKRGRPIRRANQIIRKTRCLSPLFGGRRDKSDEPANNNVGVSVVGRFRRQGSRKKGGGKRGFAGGGGGGGSREEDYRYHSKASSKISSFF